MHTLTARCIGLLAVLCPSAAAEAQVVPVTADSSVARILANARSELPSSVVLDVLRQRSKPVSAAKRREMADSLVQRIVADQGKSSTSVDAVRAITQAGWPAGQRPGIPDPDALDRLIEIDHKLGGELRSTLIRGMLAQDRPVRALPHLRSIVTSDTTTVAITALFAMTTLASREESRAESLRHLRELWDGNLVPYAPALNELACFAEKARWPAKNFRCFRG